MGDLPTGTVTFLFTDIEGSTRLLHELRDRYGDVLDTERRLLRAAFERAGGREIDTQGDAFFVAFERAKDAVAAATDAQQTLAAHAWPEGAEVRVRMGIHTGEPSVGAEGYVGVDVHRGARICAAAHGGQVVLSQPTRALLDEGVALQDLGEHRLKDLTLPQRLFQLLIPGARSGFPPLKTLENRPTNLPIQPTPFIGRDREIEAACALLRRADVRMLTLTGPGGTGKTRLALQVAADLIDEFGDGVFVVDLAALSDHALVLPSVAQTLGLREAEGEPIEATLRRYLEDKGLLLVLDNFEHVIGAGPSLADLIATCAALKVLATSRAPLHLASEHEYAVPPLRRAEAIALFSERAQAVRMDFELTDDEAPLVSEICARLDGIPLAIELAAARAKLFSPAALLERLGQRLTVLTGGARDSPARQQTLRATIDWSHGLLDEAEQALFADLAVFVGGFTLEAAEAVCGLELDTLASLVDKSLLRPEEARGGEPRFAMLETIREYALERLTARPDAAEAARRHAEHFLGLAEHAERHFRGPEQEAWQNRLEADLENLRSALTWSSEQGEHELELRLAASLAPFWEAGVQVREGRRWLEEALSRSSALPVPLRAKALFATARLAGLVQGDVRRSNELLEQSLSLFREVDDAKGVAHSLSLLGAGVAMVGEPERGRSLGEEGVTLARRLGDNWLIAMTLNNLGNVALAEGDHGYAMRLWEESLELRRPFGDKQGTASTLINLGELALGEGDVERAVVLNEEGLAIASDVGYTPFVAAALSNLGLAALRRGDTNDARSHFEECLPLCRESGDAQVTAACLAGLAGIAAEGGERDRAARLWAAAQAVHEAGGTAPSLSLAFVRRRVFAALSEVGERATAELRDEGRAMTLDEAISYALTNTPSAERERP